MTASRLFLCSAAITVAAVTFFIERHLVATHAAHRLAHQAAIERLRDEISGLRTDATTAETSAAEFEQARAAAKAGTTSVAQETSAWLARLRKLRQLVADRPAARIPEMALLTDRDYLVCARDATFGSDEEIRRLLSALRAAATRKVSGPLASALTAYVREHDKTVPPDIAALAPYLKPPLTLEHLSRWAVISTDISRPVIAEREAVDAENDSRVMIQGNGGTSTQGSPLAWIPNFNERYRNAVDSFRRANHNASPDGFIGLFPYFDPPLPPTVEETLRQRERQR